MQYNYLRYKYFLIIVKTGSDDMKIENKSFDEERAFYGERQLIIEHCQFDGPQDGESAFKECEDIQVYSTYLNLCYPFWHDHGLKIISSDMTKNCRTALWYSDHIEIKDTKMHGIKALRECDDILIKNCSIDSPEFGWMSHNVYIQDTKAISEYFLMRASNINLKNTQFKGKYSFQYVKNGLIDHCELDTKDAFWHSEDIWVKDCVLKGEYLGWYSKNLVLENCTIIGTQPFCYCEGLRLINCKMIDTDLAFERSQVNATITTPVISIKNPYQGRIVVPGVKELILDDPNAKGEIVYATN